MSGIVFYTSVESLRYETVSKSLLVAFTSADHITFCIRDMVEEDHAAVIVRQALSLDTELVNL